MNDVLKKYDLKEYEYYILLEILLNDEISLKQLIQSQQFNKNVLCEIIHSLDEKSYLKIENNKVFITDKFHQIKDHINHDLKKMDDDFLNQMDYRSYNGYINMLDDLIDYYDQ